MGRPRNNFEAAKALLEANGEMRAVDICEELGIPQATLNSAFRVPHRDGEVLKRKEGRHAFFRLPSDEPAANDETDDKPKFNAALWADGDLVLVGVEPNADGHTVTLGPDKVRVLCQLLHGQGPGQ